MTIQNGKPNDLNSTRSLLDKLIYFFLKNKLVTMLLVLVILAEVYPQPKSLPFFTSTS